MTNILAGHVPAVAITLTAVAAAILGLCLWYIAGDRDREPEHEGWEADPGELDALVDTARLPAVAAEYVGRHWEDTVGIVPAEYDPPVYSRAFAAELARLAELNRLNAGSLR